MDKRNKKKREKQEVKENGWREEVGMRKRGASSRTRQKTGV